MTEITLEFDSTKTGTGHWRCEHCKNTFYGGGRALHLEGCPLKPISENSRFKMYEGYRSCTYIFGPEELATCKRMGYTPNGPLSTKLINEQLPELLEV